MSEYKIKDGKKLRIAVSGKSGCGNTTVSTMLSERLGVNLINYTFRQLAEEKGMTLQEVIENAKTDDSYDIAVDTHQVELAMKDSCVLGSRLAIWMLKDADVKVYLIASDDTRAKRILNREGGDLEKIKEFTSFRDSQDSARYMKLYGIDNSEFEFADLKIDTATRTPEVIVDMVLDYLLSRGLVERA